jgi:signal peptide peptidase SppA
LKLNRLLTRVFNTPLAITLNKLETIVSVLMRADNGDVEIDLPDTSFFYSKDGVAVITIHGTLVKRALNINAESGLLSYEHIDQAINEAINDDAIKHIILDIDSPGGEVNGLFELVDKIQSYRLQKPIYAVANDNAFSAAYAVAAATSKIYVTRTGGVGSIGVITMHVDQSSYDAKEGLKYTPIFAGAKKNDLSQHEPITDTAKATLQQEIDRLYTLFVNSVAMNRNLSVEAIRATEAGIYFAEQAIVAKLADAIGTLETVIDAVLKEEQMPIHIVIQRKVFGF